MTKLFLSYTHPDRDAAELVSRVLRQRGWSVVWDRDMIAGDTWDAVLERQLQEVSAIVVLWSKDSVESAWVRAEATVGADRNALIPVLIEEDAEIPVRFRSIHTASLVGWQDAREAHVGFPKLTSAVEALSGPPIAQRESETNVRTSVGRLKVLFGDPLSALTALWLSGAVVNVGIILWLYVAGAMEGDSLRLAARHLNNVYAPYVALFAVLYFVRRPWRVVQKRSWSGAFRLAFLVTLVGNVAIVGMLAPLLFARGTIEQATQNVSGVGGVLFWLVGATLGYYFATSTIVRSN